MAAAADAARSLKRDFMFTARAENYLWNRPDLDDTIRRLQAFEKAGADVLYAPGIADIATVEKICKAVSKPVNVLVVPGFTVADLSNAGAKRISLGSKLATFVYGMLQTCGARDAGGRHVRLHPRRHAVCQGAGIVRRNPAR